MTASAAPGRRVPAAVRVLQVFLVGIVGAWLLLSAGLLLTFKLYRQPSASMLPAITAGDIVLVKRWAYAGRLPARGDIVVFTPPHRPDERWNKRIIGIPGDRIAFHGDGLSVNGQPLRYDDLGSYHGSGAGDGQGGVRVLREWLPGRPHTVLEQPGRFHAGSQGQWQVPAQHYFVMGDNRDNSEDSRFWPHTPFVPLQNLHGKVVAVNFRPLAAGAGGNSDRLPAGTPIQ